MTSENSGMHILKPIAPNTCRETLTGVPTILRYFARAGTTDGVLSALGPLAATQVDAWIDTAAGLLPGAGLLPLAEAVSEYLALRTFLVGDGLTLADVAIWGQLQATLQWDKLRKTNPKLVHLGRWWVGWGGWWVTVSVRWSGKDV